jgi:ABC-type maltose transport system permease subunit
MVQPKSQKLRLFITHLGLLIFIAAIMFPLLMVIAISLRSGNFATGSLIPDVNGVKNIIAVSSGKGGRDRAGAGGGAEYR